MKTDELLKLRPAGKMTDEMASKTAAFLNQALANEYALFTKTLNYHWNIVGPRFHSIHTFLETQYKELLTVMDDVAERVRIIDETPIATVQEMAKVSTLFEKNGERLSSNEMLLDLFSSHLKIHEDIKTFLKSNNDVDMVTEDFLISLMSNHEKRAWMFKSHLAS